MPGRTETVHFLLGNQGDTHTPVCLETAFPRGSQLGNLGGLPTMTGLLITRPTHAPVSEHANGRHQEWECQQHEQEARTYAETGSLWSYDYRIWWIQRYFTITPHTVAHSIRSCDVCSREAADALMGEATATAAITRVKNEVRALSRRIASKLGAKSRHIDRT
jgi:hypothetical protein